MARSILTERMLAPLVAVAGAIGIGGALVLTRLAEKMLFGIRAADPATFALAMAGVTLAALGSAYLPGRNAAKLNPIETLRCDELAISGHKDPEISCRYDVLDKQGVSGIQATWIE